MAWTMARESDVQMSDVTLSLSRSGLPVQYGNTTGSLVERFYTYAAELVEKSEADTPDGAVWIEVETDFEGVFVAYRKFQPTTTDHDLSSSWVGQVTISDWIEIKQFNPDDEQRSVILRINGGIFYIATTSEDFMTALILSQTP